MFTRLLSIVAVFALILVAAAMTTGGTAEDASDARLADLETRVAALETAVAAGEDDQDGRDGASGQPGQDGQDGEDGQNSSSSSSVQQSSGSFTGVYSGTGDRTVDLELRNGGDYQLMLNASGAASITLNGADGPIADFDIEADAAGTVTRTATLEPGTYWLEIRSATAWSVTLLFVG